MSRRTVMHRTASEQQPRKGKPFRHAARLVQADVRKASESRGFAVSRLLTHWAEIAGSEIAGIARPVDVRYGREGFGATLTVLTIGAQAPMLEMQKEKLRERVNRCYGYSAISRIRITQTAPKDFADGQVEFTPAPKRTETEPDPAMRVEAARATAPIGDDALREALTALGAQVLNKKIT